MDAGDVYDALREFIDTLEESGREVSNTVRGKALELVADAQNLSTDLSDSAHKEFYKFNAYVGQLSNDIHDAFSENDLYVIMTTFLQALGAVLRKIAEGH